MPNSLTAISLSIGEQSLDPERELNLLQAELDAIPRLSIRRIVTHKPTSPGTKGVFQEVTLTLTAATPTLSLVASVLRTWLKSREKRSIKLTMGNDSLELSGPGSGAQDRALDQFLQKYTGAEAAKQTTATSNTKPSGKKNKEK